MCLPQSERRHTGGPQMIAPSGRGWLRRRPRPRDRRVERIEGEGLHLCLDEVLPDAWPECGELAIRGERNPPDLPVVIADEPYVANEPSQVFPPWEPARVNDEPLQMAMRFDPRIGRDRQLVEIARAQ